MASLLSILKNVLNLNKNHMHANSRDVEIVMDTVRCCGEVHNHMRILVHARPYKSKQRICPICGRKCSGYDHKRQSESMWRAPNLDGIPVYICYCPERIECPEHGVLTEMIPWADGSSRFTEAFNDEIAWLVCRMSRTDIATFEGINWRTVGNCINASLKRIEPDVSERIHDGLRRICVDETSYRKGHSYITVVYDMDRNRVVWVHKGNGFEVFRRFCESLTEKERAAIRIVAGDGAKWIDQCVREYFPNATRCIDPYHVAAWANEALDKVRISTSTKAVAALRSQENAIQKAAARETEAAGKAWELMESIIAESIAGPITWQGVFAAYLSAWNQTGVKPAKPTADRRRRSQSTSLLPGQKKELDSLSACVEAVRGSKHALGHKPENCTENQAEKLRIIENSFPDLYRAYQLKEALRLILHMTDPLQAEAELDKWIEEAASSKLTPMKELSEKISRYRQAILDSVRYQANSAKSEATNASIKLLVRMARGFQSLENLIALIYLKCSDLVIPLFNRPQMTSEQAATRRKTANEARRLREAGTIF